jgi:large subunit ribosomal protein L25
VSRTLPVLCKPSDIPEKIEVDVSNLGIAESLHIKDVKAPAGVQFKVRGDQTIAVVNIPEKEEEVVKPAAAAVPGAEGAAAVPGAAPGAPGAPGAAPGAPGAAAPAAGAPAAGAGKAPAADKGGKKSQ